MTAELPTSSGVRRRLPTCGSMPAAASRANTLSGTATRNNSWILRAANMAGLLLLACWGLVPAVQAQALSLSGSPPGTALAGSVYQFIPEVSGADCTGLQFSITRRPSWASFNSQTGLLSGTPDAGDVGNYTGIRITVSDGVSSDELGPFAVRVTDVGAEAATLDWLPPTTNADGSSLSDLAGYVVHYGTRSRVYTSQVSIGNPGLTSYTLSGLVPGTYFFALTAVDDNGNASALSKEVKTTLGDVSPAPAPTGLLCEDIDGNPPPALAATGGGGGGGGAAGLPGLLLGAALGWLGRRRRARRSAMEILN